MSPLLTYFVKVKASFVYFGNENLVYIFNILYYYSEWCDDSSKFATETFYKHCFLCRLLFNYNFYRSRHQLQSQDVLTTLTIKDSLKKLVMGKVN